MAKDNERPKEQLAYVLPDMGRVRTRKDITYKTVDELELKLDVYYPNHMTNTFHPAVLFLHGDAAPNVLKDAKEWTQYVQWGQLVAASGLIGIASNHRSTEKGIKFNEVAQDIDDLISFVREHATDLNIDKDRLCLWTCSAGGPVTLRTVLRDAPMFVRCIVAYYCLLDLQHMRARFDASITDATLQEFSPLYHLQQNNGKIAPILIARAGRDYPDFNIAADAFIAGALVKNAPIGVINHPTGQHAFDLRDHDQRSQEIIKQTLAFMLYHLNE